MKDRIVPALKQVAAYAATKGIVVGMQNHGDMAATAAQTIQILKWVGNPDLKLIDDTGYFAPFADVEGADYPWYHDIAQELPYSVSSYIKLAPAGAGAPPPMDFDRLFTDFRLTSYRGYLPLEELWASTDPNNPHNLTHPPYGQVAAFLAKVKAALAQTQTSPFVSIAQAITALQGSGDLGAWTAAQLFSDLQKADCSYTAGAEDLAMQAMQSFLAHAVATGTAGSPGYVSAAAAQELGPEMTALLQSIRDVSGWPVSLSDTVPATLTDSAAATPVNVTVKNNTGQAIPSTRLDVSLFPENESYSPSNPHPTPPLILDPSEVTLQYLASAGTYAAVPLTPQPGVVSPSGTRPTGALIGNLPPQAGAALATGRTSISLRISINGVPASNKVIAYLSLGQVDSAGNVTTPGIAAHSTEVSILAARQDHRYERSN